MASHKLFRRQEKLMGSAFEFVIRDEERTAEILLQEAVDEVKRIENLLTEFSDTSFTAQLNRAAGKKAVLVDDEVYSILKRSYELSKLTQGAFDITAGAFKKLYNFKGEHFKLPSADVLRQTAIAVGYEKIELLSDNYIYLKTQGMHIGFGAIGKGYAADVVKKMWQKKGVRHGVINASGDLTAWGMSNEDVPWKIGIADPSDQSKIILWIPIENASVATSGDYEQFFERNGIRYAHTIDPRTGQPVTGIKSVTVIGPSAELSDALATAVFVMGASVGLDLIEQLPGVHAVVVNDKNKVLMSSHLKLNVNEALPV